jgi:hypothetical protein
MGRQTRNPWNVLLFFLVIVTIAYLCKRGWEGFYNRPGVWVSTRFIQLIHGHHWWTWDVPIPTADGIYSCVADAGDGRKIMWMCTVRGGEYTVSGLSKQGNVCDVRLHFSATMNQGASPSTSSAYVFPTYPSRHRPAYFGIDFWYCSPAGANYVLTVTQIDPPIAPPPPPPPPPPPVAAPATAPCGIVNIVEASYGLSCGASFKNNQQANVQDTINKTIAYVTGKSTEVPKRIDMVDPAPGCPKDMTIVYNCGDGNDIRIYEPPSFKQYYEFRFNCRLCQNPPPPPPPPPAASRSAPVYMPPETINQNRKRTTKTCGTCASAPLLSSLPTPSIAHNVNLPHYSQRLTDDGGL